MKSARTLLTLIALTLIMVAYFATRRQGEQLGSSSIGSSSLGSGDGLPFFQSSTQSKGVAIASPPSGLRDPKDIEDWKRTKTDILKPETGVEEAGFGDIMTVKYSMIHGESGRMLEPNRIFTFVVGTGAVFRGLNLTAVGRRTGGLSRMTIPADLGFDEPGFDSYKEVHRLPQGSTLVLEVEALEIKKANLRP